MSEDEGNTLSVTVLKRSPDRNFNRYYVSHRTWEEWRLRCASGGFTFSEDGTSFEDYEALLKASLDTICSGQRSEMYALISKLAQSSRDQYTALRQEARKILQIEEEVAENERRNSGIQGLLDPESEKD